MIRSILFDKTSNFPSVRISLHSILMENKLKTAGKTLGVLGALATSVAKGADIDQLKAQYEQQMAQASDAVMKVLQSGEGCDVSLLNTAMASNDYTEYIACADIQRISAEIDLANVEQALKNEKPLLQAVSEDLASEDKDIAELTQEQKSKLDRKEQDKTMLVMLSKEAAEARARILVALLK